MSSVKVPPDWEKWCLSGRHRGSRKKKALLRSLVDGSVRGYLSDLPLRPDQETVVEARIINDMKSHLTEGEFWRVIEHLFAVGVQKGRIKAPYGKRLPKSWRPTKHFGKPAASIEVAIALAESAPATSSELITSGEQ